MHTHTYTYGHSSICPRKLVNRRAHPRAYETMAAKCLIFHSTEMVRVGKSGGDCFCSLRRRMMMSRFIIMKTLHIHVALHYFASRFSRRVVSRSSHTTACLDELAMAYHAAGGTMRQAIRIMTTVCVCVYVQCSTTRHDTRQLFMLAAGKFT